jgi:hypothetical protein
MSDKTSKDLAADVRNTLLNQQALIKKASVEKGAMLERNAALEEHVRILSDVMDLVSKGVIDPSDAVSKVAEFLQDPQGLEVIKQAYMLGFDGVPRIGVPQAQERPVNQTAEAPLIEVLRDLETRKQQ